jgi:hypothetical protein
MTGLAADRHRHDTRHDLAVASAAHCSEVDLREQSLGPSGCPRYTVFVIDLASRRVHLLGSTPHPSDLFMGQIVRLVTAADDGVLIGHRVLICDRDRKWSVRCDSGWATPASSWS